MSSRDHQVTMGDRRYENSSNTEGREDSPNLPLPRYTDRREGGPPAYRGREPRAGRVYVGNLPNNAERSLIQDLFSKFGTILEISIKRTISGTPFAFVEFEDPRDAQDAIQDRDGYKIDGCALRVEIPFAARGTGGRVNNNNNRGPPRRADYRVIIRGLPPSGSWQDLKDHMREAGDCVYTDVFRDGTGVVEFARREDMEYALRHLSDSRFVSHEGEQSRITVTRDRESYPRRSCEKSRYRGRSPGYGGGSRGGGYGGPDSYGVYGRHGYERGHDDRRYYDKNYSRYYPDREKRGDRSRSRACRSISYNRRSRTCSRSYHGQY